MSESVLTLEAINERLASASFNRWLGIRAVEASPQRAQLRMPWRAELEGGKGMTHGGIFACVIDVSAFAVILAAKGQSGPTIDMRVDFHANAIEGDFMITAEMLRAGSRIVTVDVRVHSAAGKLLATGRCVYAAAR
ncbi:PaaI family thioesterase [Peristeroidobacter soli]|jgi:uncharacterized protein (TIGR00369 family)|uniref:PaaI family thioesterase n=1 Tax=Peristeroidobacter soli TaxID=2497877 RepID=UPI00101C459E|nr:PaaI family thioesterase [Peristeroidobacter soli]